MIKKKLVLFIAPALLIAVLVTACTEKEPTQESTVFNLRMTDDPLENVQEVNIDLRTIIVTDDGRDSFELGTNAGVYNLLDYQGELDTLIGSITLDDATFIKEIRLVLGENNTIMHDSVLYDLKTPSAQQSGLKIKVNADLSELDVYELLIDFDAGASVTKTGNAGYNLKPVIRIVE